MLHNGSCNQLGNPRAKSAQSQPIRQQVFLKVFFSWFSLFPHVSESCAIAQQLFVMTLEQEMQPSALELPDLLTPVFQVHFFLRFALLLFSSEPEAVLSDATKFPPNLHPCLVL